MDHRGDKRVGEEQVLRHLDDARGEGEDRVAEE